MNRLNNKLIALIPAVMLLTACHQQSPSVGVPSVSNTTSSAEHATVTPQQASVLSVTPSSMAACDPAVATVNWNASGRAGVSGVQIYVGTGADEKLFAAGGATGSATTGLWTRPGSMFTAKNAADGSILGSVTVQGPVCK